MIDIENDLHLEYATSTTPICAMYVCICKAVSDQEIHEAVAQGAEDLSAIQDRLGAATGCGTCVEYTKQVINEALLRKLSYAA